MSAATCVAALGVSGCGHDDARTATQPVIPTSETGVIRPAAPPSDAGPLPTPEALSGVIARLADPGVSGNDKLPLVENTAPDDAAALDSFATALRDSGLTPVTVRASDIRWLASRPGDVVATITVTGPEIDGPAQDGTGDFSFPMEFRRGGDGWQLTRETAEMLLAFGNARSPAPAPPR